MTSTIKIISVNANATRGRKYPVDQILIDVQGVQGDVHAGSLRPVSMMDIAAAERFYLITGAQPLEYGSFAENITFETDQELDARIFDRFLGEDVLLEVVFKGKPFHDQFRDPGHYLMPREGLFCRVFKGGMLKAGDEMKFLPKVFNIKIITLSDRAFRGVYDDRSGPVITKMVETLFSKLNWRFDISTQIMPDDEMLLEEQLTSELTQHTDLIITTGGTGIGPRDITPDIMRKFIQKEIPGIMEMIRWKYGVEKPTALVSRAIAGVSGQTLLFALPGSVKAVTEYMTEISKHIEHLYYMIHAVELH
ncbi:MAG: molybdenum cofactor synthesis protein [Bacteroidales bacterium]|nr:molybdenum cofactor synthesis protein [Bacteroidales bacterium]